MPSSVVKKALHDMYTELEELRPSGETLEKMVDELFDTNLTSTMNKELASIIGMKDVYAHGDLWSTNILWSKRGDGVKFSRIIDHQYAHFGCAAEDLCRVFISTLSGKHRRENWERLLEEFHKYIVQYSKGELPFTVEQLKEAYRRMFPLAGLLLSDIFESIMKIATQRLSSEERTAAEGVVHEKVLALFEDVVFFAERNRSVRKNL
ncbi:hypothetical protein OESDEN_07681 [Oesophagostomum dentatum]|uniref:CHK kinase-like domain-containing protein n=1 Tax=Oesophagostomum dentatum TaxID=61180 RepID=A0A0B1T9D2_OESDE|nr:hypothetical protein OESDEN_07681 [Oesophagostomum dentatum]